MNEPAPAPADEGAIRLSGVGLALRGVSILRDVSMRTAPGRITVLIGENGAGKTSVIRLVAGLRRPDGGSIFIRPSPTPRRAVFVFEEPTLYGHLSGRAHRSVLGARDVAAWSAACAELGLDARLLGRRAGGYSFGQRRKVTLAAAFGAPGDLPMVFDEPTNGLDPSATQAFVRMAREAADGGRDLLITGQDFETLGALADRVYRLRGGRVELTADWRAHAEGEYALEVLFTSGDAALTVARRGWVGGRTLLADRSVTFLGDQERLQAFASSLMGGSSAASIASIALRPKDLGRLLGEDVEDR